MSPKRKKRGFWRLTDAKSDRKKVINLGGHNYLFYRHRTTKLWWSKDMAKHGGCAFKVYEEVGKKLHWVHDADDHGDWIVNKHKGPFAKVIQLN